MNVLEEHAAGVDITEAFPPSFVIRKFIVSHSSIGGDGGLGPFVGSVFGDIRHVSRLTPTRDRVWRNLLLLELDTRQANKTAWPFVPGNSVPKLPISKVPRFPDWLGGIGKIRMPGSL
jgi:hypothetical protein